MHKCHGPWAPYGFPSPCHNVTVHGPLHPSISSKYTCLAPSVRAPFRGADAAEFEFVRLRSLRCSLLVCVSIKIHNRNTPQAGLSTNVLRPSESWKRWTARILRPSVQQVVRKILATSSGSILPSAGPLSRTFLSAHAAVKVTIQ